ncbi:MAG: L,D-transpeptidase family protein [Solirubrobacteraceae bacterium]
MSAIKVAKLFGLVALLAIGLAAVGVGTGLGSLESHLSSASDSRGMLPATKLTALPHHAISDGTLAVRVRLSGAPASFSPRPTFTPAVAGTWTIHGDSEIFTPASTLDPCATYTLTIPAASTALSHSPLGATRRVSVSVACPSVRGLQQILARLAYLPYESHSSERARALEDAAATTDATATGSSATTDSSEATTGSSTTAASSEVPYAHESRAHLDRRVAAIDAFDPDPETPRSRVADAPPLEYGHLDETTKGAVMVFQSNHELEPTGEPDTATWTALLKAAEKHERNPSPYTFVTVSESIPETLEVHKNSHVVLTTPANTGVAGAETAQGIFPIFSRFTSTTMTGTNPDGSKYSDPGVPWVNYFNGGDAVHGFPRGSYGTPQSNGCVELPIETAHTVFDMLQVGDIVEVS